MTIIRQPVTYFAAFWGILIILTNCGGTPQAQSTPTITAPTLIPSHPSLPTSTPTAQKTISNRDLTRTAFPLTLTSHWLTNPPPTSTTTPVIHADGNVTWHPQKLLVQWVESPNDGNEIRVAPNFLLYWDGTLKSSHIEGSNSTNTILKIGQDEICKILNTIATSGFFEETQEYNLPIMGAWGSYIGINGWKSNASGSQMLGSLIGGASYSNSLICRNCPIPWAHTIIKPGLANTYYFLQNYQPVKPDVVPVTNILVDISPSDKESTATWPLTSVTFDEFIEILRCKRENCTYTYEPTLFSGELAQEIMTKLRNGATFKSDMFDSASIQVTYESDVSDVPADAMLTCNIKGPIYPILPLNKNSKFWYYGPSGKWGAERIEGQNKMRVVNTTGYEKFYEYDAAFFGQAAIDVYPRFWSEDNQFFYVNVLPADFAPNVSLVNSIGLEQIAVKNEKIKYLFLGKQGEKFAYELTKDGKQVAYIRDGDSPLKLVVAKTSSGDEHAVRLMRPDGIPYTSAGTLVWSYYNDSIFFAASYTENGKEKTDILWTHLDNLALRVIYTAESLMKLREDGGGYSSAFICPISTNADDYGCKISLNTETGEIQ